MSEVELSAGVLEYDDTRGDLPVVVLLNGLFIGRSVWRSVVADLRSDHRCLPLELPLGAHRRAMRDGADLSGRGLAGLVAEFLDHLDLWDVTLVGCDWGGSRRGPQTQARQRQPSQLVIEERVALRLTPD